MGGVGRIESFATRWGKKRKKGKNRIYYFQTVEQIVWCTEANTTD
jgi:hypothetical protein